MKVVKTPITVSVLLFITREELWHIIKQSKLHYDWKCRQASTEGGFLYGWANQMWKGNSAEVHAEWDQLDLMVKILEMPGSDGSIYKFLRNTLTGLSTKQERLNKKESAV